MPSKRQKNKKFFSFDSLVKNQKAQVGETMTWVVATIIIIIILIVSIFVSAAYFGGGKNVNFFKRTDVLASKSLFSYLLTEDSGGNIVYNQLRNEENLNEFNGNLGMEIFKKFYEEEYEDVWLGIFNLKQFSGEPNPYYGERPKDVQFEETKVAFAPRKISETIELNEAKAIQTLLFQE